MTSSAGSFPCPLCSGAGQDSIIEGRHKPRREKTKQEAFLKGHWNWEWFQVQRFQAFYVVSKEHRNMPVSLWTKSHSLEPGDQRCPICRGLSGLPGHNCCPITSASWLRHGGPACLVRDSALPLLSPIHPPKATETQWVAAISFQWLHNVQFQTRQKVEITSIFPPKARKQYEIVRLFVEMIWLWVKNFFKKRSWKTDYNKENRRKTV